MSAELSFLCNNLIFFVHNSTTMNRGQYNTKTIKQKAEIVREWEKDRPSFESLAKKHKLGTRTIAGYIKQRKKILNDALEAGSSKMFRKRNAQHDLLEQQLYEEFTQLRNQSLPALGVWLQSRAKSIAIQQNIANFQASNHWLDNFKRRFNLTTLKACGEASKVDPQNCKEWLIENRAKLLNFAPNDIYNCDETGLFYRLLPNRTLAVKGSKCHGGSASKERVSILLCTTGLVRTNSFL